MKTGINSVVLFLLFLLLGCSHLPPQREVPSDSVSPFPSGSNASQTHNITASASNLDVTGELSLSQALALTLTNNPRLSVYSWEIRAKEAEILQAGLLPNPVLEMEAENLLGTGSYSGVNQIEATTLLTQLIELGGKRIKRHRLAQWDKELAVWDYEAARLDVLAETHQAFLEVLVSQQEILLLEELVMLGEEVFRTASERVQAGKVSPIEETRAAVILADLRLQRNQADRRLEGARKRLAILWDSREPHFTRVVGRLEEVTPIPAWENIAQRLAQNPDVARWATEMNRQQAALALAQSQAISDVEVGGGIRYLNEDQDGTLVLGFSLPLPISNRNQGAIEAASHRIRLGEEAQRSVEIEALTSLTEAYRQLSTAYMEVLALQNEILPGALHAFESISSGYRQGKFSYLDVLDSQRTLFETRLRHLQALALYHQAVVQVERLTGESLHKKSLPMTQE